MARCCVVFSFVVHLSERITRGFVTAPLKTPFSRGLSGKKNFLNAFLESVEKVKGGTKKSLDQTATLPIKLRAGWNEIRFRGYGYGYSPFRVGLMLEGPEEDLWKLRLADYPPVE